MSGHVADAADRENRQAKHREFVAGRDRSQPAISGQALPHQRHQ